MYGREGEEFSLALAGDAILTRRFSVCEDPRLDRLLDPVRAADAGVVNLEVLLHDYEGYPAADSGGTYMRAPPELVEELSAAGFSMLAAANNHTGDYSHGGMEATMDALDDRGWAYAGLGEHLAGALEPAYVDTPGGRVGLVAACSTITPGSVAGPQRPDLDGRPGLAPLRLKTRYVLPGSDVEALREMAERLGLEGLKRDRETAGFRVPGEDEDAYTFPVVGGSDHVHVEAGDPTRVRRFPVESDREAVLDRIRAANRQADWVVASVHAHEGEGARFNDDTVPGWLESVAHDCVDAGADVVFGHGPHVLRGMEVYDGAPVFYSLGDFLMGNETVTRLPGELYDRYDLDDGALPADLFDARAFEDGDPDADRRGFPADPAFWETVVPVCRWAEGDLDEVELLPATLGHESPRPQRGRPLLADGETATRVLDGLAELSEPYGTEVIVEDGRGYVRPE
jgi:poly-gamma-glutamate synthesis protein (capsule biosynthesis protein)